MLRLLTTHSRRFFLIVLYLARNHMVLSFESRGAALVTGATDGIGVTTAKHLALKGFDVLLHGRDVTRIRAAQETVQSFVGKNAASKIIALPPADLSTVQESQKLADNVIRICREEKLDLKVLMNNAGVYSEKHVVTPDGTELTFSVNVVAPFVITSRLLPIMLHENTMIDRRVVIASSISQCGSIRDWNDMAYQNRSYSAHIAYSESKLLDAMLTIEFADRLLSKNIGTDRITVNCLDPGTVNTKMLLAGWGPIGIDVEDALDQTWLCSSDEVKGLTGKYFTYQNERRAARSAYETTERQKMWDMLSDLAPEESKMWDLDWL